MITVLYNTFPIEVMRTTQLILGNLKPLIKITQYFMVNPTSFYYNSAFSCPFILLFSPVAKIFAPFLHLYLIEMMGGR